MSWEEWEQVRTAAAHRQSSQMQLNQLPADQGGSGTAVVYGPPSGKLRSDRTAWAKAGTGFGDLRDNLGKARTKLADGQTGLGTAAGCLTSVAQVAALALLLTGCGPSGTHSSSKEQTAKMNMQEAAEHADAILDETFAAIKPAVEWTHTYSMPGDCFVDRDRSVMTIISAERRGAFLGVVERHWKSKGYKLVATSENGLAANFNTQDGFQIQVLVGTTGQANFSVTTPCVEKSEVAPPTSSPNGPDYSKQETPAPNIYSKFWSVKAPISR